MIFALVFWLAVMLILHSYVLYPLLAWLIGRTTAASMQNPAALSEERLPSVAVVVAAHNEEQHVDARLRNLLALDYPADRLAVYIGSDGSSDRTGPIAQAHASDRVHVIAYPFRRGKASVLNDLVAAVGEDIVVFTDANTVFSRGALRSLVRHFADATVGAVSGELKLKEPTVGDNQDSHYWRLETAIKIGESRIGGLLGANGGIYAIRRSLYSNLPADTIIDDFTIVMNVAVRGWRTVFDAQAVAYEDVPPGIDAEFRRRVRIGTGNYQAFFRYPEYWWRSSNVRRFTYVSHKVLRWFTPHLLIVAFFASAMLLANSFYRAVFVAQLTGHVFLGSAMLLRRRVVLPRAINLPLFLFALNLAFLIGFWRFASGNISGQWHRTERT